jgi:anti-sigma regulatory factor (Ser/Thr protein kinase)
MRTQTFPADPGALGAIRRLVRSEGTAADLDEGALGDVVLATSEASANAVLHSGGTQIWIQLAVIGPCFEVNVEDDGTFGGDGRSRGQGHGRGLGIIRAVMDEVRVRRGLANGPGTRVTMRKCGDEKPGRDRKLRAGARAGSAEGWTSGRVDGSGW